MENEQNICPTCGQEIPKQGNNQDVIEIANWVHKTIKPLRIKKGVVYVSPQAVKKIKARLKSWSIDELRLAIRRFSNNKWRMENNRNKSLDWFFKTDSQIETFLQLEQDIGGGNQTNTFIIGNKEYHSIDEIELAEKKGEIFYDNTAKRYIEKPS